MSEPPVLKKAEDVDVPLICIRQAVDQDHEECDPVQSPKHRAARLLGEKPKSSDEDEVAQEVEEPMREIARQVRERNFPLGLR
jgi:hypothetical protein